MTNTEEIEIRRDSMGDATVLHPIGDIDLSRAPSLRVRLGEELRKKPARLIIDLADVSYMDSSGVATFVEAMQLARRGGSRLILCCLQDRVRSIFEIARLDMVFVIKAGLQEAATA
jgi:anti-sigma B factor antagonist